MTSERGAEPSSADVRRWRRYLADERAEAAVYRDLAARRTGEEREILLALADAEGRHEQHWVDLLGDHAKTVPAVSLRTRILGFFARRFGSIFFLALAQRAEGRSPYEADAHATDAMAADERVHAEVVRGLAARGRQRLAGTFRAAVFGANDGLVSNLALVLGIGATGVAPQIVLFTGLAGLLAGALSMAAGEYVSVRSQRELFEYQIGLEADELRKYPEAEAEELALIYIARGMEPGQARAFAHQLVQDPKQALDVLAREELGLNPDDLGSPIGAAVFSFSAFTVGALVPLLPFFLGSALPQAAYWGTGLAAAGLFGTGASMSLFSGRNPWLGGLRMLGIGALAGVRHRPPDRRAGWLNGRRPGRPPRLSRPGAKAYNFGPD